MNRIALSISQEVDKLGRDSGSRYFALSLSQGRRRPSTDRYLPSSRIDCSDRRMYIPPRNR